MTATVREVDLPPELRRILSTLSEALGVRFRVEEVRGVIVVRQPGLWWEASPQCCKGACKGACKGWCVS